MIIISVFKKLTEYAIIVRYQNRFSFCISTNDNTKDFLNGVFNIFSPTNENSNVLMIDKSNNLNQPILICNGIINLKNYYDHDFERIFDVKLKTDLLQMVLTDRNEMFVTFKGI